MDLKEFKEEIEELSYLIMDLSDRINLIWDKYYIIKDKIRKAEQEVKK